MKWINILKKSPHVVILACFLTQILGCGTILYPERRGQRNGQIDAGVAVLDGVGLLVFIVPGVIAFAVDFADGAIYLPGGRRALYPEEIRAVRVNPGELSREKISEIVARETGVTAALDPNKTRAFALNGAGDIAAELAYLESSGYRAQ